MTRHVCGSPGGGSEVEVMGQSLDQPNHTHTYSRGGLTPTRGGLTPTRGHITPTRGHITPTRGGLTFTRGRLTFH